jgi:hypothetical protein
MTEPHTLVDRYMAIWNEPDNDVRSKAIADLWAPHGVHYVQTLAAEDHETMVHRVRRAYQKWVRDEGFVFRPAGNTVARDNLVKFNWEMVPAGTDDVVSVGFDFLILDDDGRILADHQFNEPPVRDGERESLADRYVAIDTEPDEDLRRAAVEQLWSPDGVLVHDTGTATGHQAIADLVAAEYRTNTANGMAVVRSGDADGHRNAVRFTTHVAPAAGGPAVTTRFDIVFLGDDGRILCDYRFTEALPDS